MTRFAPADAVADLSFDGKSFLVVAPVDPAPPVLVTMNWAAAVRPQLRTTGATK